MKDREENKSWNKSFSMGKFEKGFLNEIPELILNRQHGGRTMGSKERNLFTRGPAPKIYFYCLNLELKLIRAISKGLEVIVSGFIGTEDFNLMSGLRV